MQPYNSSPRYPTSTQQTIEAERLRVAAGRSYVSPAIVTLILYFVLWLPGMIANVVYLRSAQQTQKLTGHAPEGKGCLTAMAVVFLVLPLAGFVILGIALAAGGH